MRAVAGQRKTVVFLIGAPGVGKSTTSRRLAADFGLHAFQSGQVLRDAAKNAKDPRLRQLIDFRMKRSMPMPVEVYCRLVRDHIPRGASNGLVFDGYPRNVEQTTNIPAVLETVSMTDDQVIGFVLEAPQDVLIARSATRFVCGTCGQETQGEGGCCQAPRVHRRADDSMGHLLARSERFHELLPSVRQAFASRWPCFDINAGRSHDEVLASIRNHLQLFSESLGDL
ncbi:nucleoside monophosphate kinase [Streptomyces sp. NPDC052236]|uniref:nucleoside monophosphate kinase n=1 Tax=Streptomyces sp. NPDC052236 TaxID=3365686 RepID=UPI0037D0E6AF